MIVVGAGVIGSSIAFRLAQAGIGVTIVEPRFPGSGTSGNTFSWVNSFDKKPLAYHQLNVRGLGEHRVLAEEIGSRDCLHLDGALMWEGPDPSVDAGAESTSREDANRAYRGVSGDMLRGRLAAKIDATRSMGYQIEEITPDEVMELEPDLRIDPDAVQVVYLMPMEGWVETAGLAHRLCSAAVRRHGARLLEAVSVTEVATSGGRVTGVRLSDGSSLAADMVVNAAGPAGGRLAAAAGGMLPVQRSLGVNFVTSAVATQLTRVIHAGGTALRPESPTRVMVGGQGFDSTVVEGEPFPVDDARCVAALEDAALTMPRLLHACIESVRVGTRAIPGDGLSAIGPDSVVPGLYHAITHSGATLSALIGRLVCADLLGAMPPELEPFRPARFAAPGAGHSHAGSSE
jgi:glycine/D-amino acid oxidase-like deaminating enzyme